MQYCINLLIVLEVGSGTSPSYRQRAVRIRLRHERIDQIRDAMAMKRKEAEAQTEMTKNRKGLTCDNGGGNNGRYTE